MSPEQPSQYANTRPIPGMDVMSSRPAAPINVAAMATMGKTPGTALNPIVGSATKAHWSDRPLVAGSLDLCFRIGFGLVFMINSVTAILQPAGFKKLIEANFLAHAIGHTQWQLYLICVNDALLGVLIVSGIKRQWVYAWAGLWLFIVTFIKFTSF